MKHEQQNILDQRFQDGELPGAVQLVVGPEDIPQTVIVGFADIEAQLTPLSGWLQSAKR